MKSKIAIISQPWNRINPESLKGSIPIICNELAKRLSGLFDVTIYCARGVFQKRDEIREHVKFRRYSTYAQSAFLVIINRLFFFKSSKKPLFASCLYYFLYILLIALDIRRKKFDLVHVINFSQFIPVLRFFNPNIKIVLHMECEWLNQLNRKMIESRLHHVDLIIGCSEFITQKIKKAFPQFSFLCRTVYNGVDANIFKKTVRVHSANHEEKNLLFIGRVSPEKGIHTLIDAFNKVVEKYPKTKITIVGPLQSVPYEFIGGFSEDPKAKGVFPLFSTDYMSYLKNRIKAGFSDHVTFTGPLNNSELPELYANADIFVFPSIWDEPFGIPIIEAMSVGVPVIGARVGGIKETVIDKETGLLVTPGIVEELANAIILLLSDKKLQKRLRKNGPEHAINMFSWKKITGNLIDAYQQIL